jgi:transposase-like protein
MITVKTMVIEMKKARRQSKQNRWSRDTVKEKYWRDQVARWQKSGLSVRAFCAERGVVETSFYAWRRELIIRARESGELDEQECVEGAPNAVRDSRGRMIPVRFRQTDSNAAQSLGKGAVENNPFVAVKIVPNEPEPIERDEPANSGVTISMPSGCRISIRNIVDIGLLRQVLNIMEDKQC